MANLICAKCNQPIDEENAIECPFCWEIYHKECWEELSNCVTCKKFNPIYDMVQEQKQLQEEQTQYETTTEDNQTEELEEVVEKPGKEISYSLIADKILLVSKIILVVGVVLGLVFMVYALFMFRNIIGGIFGVVIGSIIAVSGWMMSILVEGFAELVNNSQKNAYYLSKLVEKKEEKE